MAASEGALGRLDRWLAGLPVPVVLLLAVLLLGGCVLVDLLTGPELSFSIIYLAPTGLAAWYAGRNAGVLMAFSASLTWLYVDIGTGNLYSNPMIPVWNSLVRLGFFLIVSYLLLQIRRLLARLRDQADTDNLTGLANSRCFHARLDLERERALRYRHPFTIAYLDLDDFKRVNDRWGHETGDQVLQNIAQLLPAGLRRTDLVARLGGDEFAILLADTGAQEAREALLKLHARLLKEMEALGWPIGCSIGAICCRDPLLCGTRELVRQADELMYRVKRSGKNRLEVVGAVAPPHPAPAGVPLAPAGQDGRRSRHRSDDA